MEVYCIVWRAQKYFGCMIGIFFFYLTALYKLIVGSAMNLWDNLGLINVEFYETKKRSTEPMKTAINFP